VISIVQLGRIDYATALELQRSLVELRKRGEIGDVLLLLEHTPVITLGRNAKAEHVLASREQLAARGVEVFECDRGGDVTYHGPGQLVGYPIFDLRGNLRGFPTPEGPRKTLGAVEFVRRLEEVLIRTCADFGIGARRVPGRTGVWTEQNDAKVAAIGVHISRGVTSHGFALNVATDLEAFELIVPCGIADKSVTSLGRELGNVPALNKVAESAARNFGAVFQSQILWVETLEVLLGERIGVPMKPPAELRQMHGEAMRGEEETLA